MASVRDIVKVSEGSPILREKAKKVQRIDTSLQRLIDDMAATMREAPGVGLAAPQVGVGLRLIVVEAPPEEDDPQSGKLYAVINPEIIKASPEKEEGEEGCLSIPGWNGLVNRHVWVVVKGFDREGKEFRIRARDYVARIFQHEIDHLNGVLFTDHITDRKKLWKSDERPAWLDASEAADEPEVIG